jgi:hypothetical protein
MYILKKSTESFYSVTWIVTPRGVFTFFYEFRACRAEFLCYKCVLNVLQRWKSIRRLWMQYLFIIKRAWV